MSIPNHTIVQEYLHEIQRSLNESSNNSHLWEQIHEDILEHIQDAYDNRDINAEQNVTIILSSILQDLGSPSNIAQAYLDAKIAPDQDLETSLIHGDHQIQNRKRTRFSKTVLAGLSFPLRKTYALIKHHKKILVPYILIVIVLYSSLSASQSIFRNENTTPLILNDSLGRPLDDPNFSRNILQMEIVEDQLILLDDEHPSHLYFYSLDDARHPSHCSTINIGWSASSMEIIGNITYVVSQEMNRNENGSQYKINIYDISDISDVTFLGNFTSPQIPDLYSFPQMVFVNSSLLIVHDSREIYFHSVVNQTNIDYLSRHNVTEEEESNYYSWISNIQIYEDLIYLSAQTSLFIYDYVNNSAFVRLKVIDLGTEILNFQISNDIAYILGYYEVISLDIANINNPQMVMAIESDRHNHYQDQMSMDLNAGKMFFSYEYSGGITQMDTDGTGALHVVGEYGEFRRVRDLKHFENVLFIADGYEGVQIWNMEVFAREPIYQKLTAILNWTLILSTISLSILFIGHHLWKKNH